uniref:Uncharacterized protein n=1 Tax=Trichobilharzia regenti TaxID=157069 RepID=A0AA85JJM3_TRIRE|nr:unnamed protein product [Trichobilharzia regenti]
MSDTKENPFKHPKRKTECGAPRQLTNKATTQRRYTSCARDEPITVGRYSNRIVKKHQSSPKSGANVSLTINDSVASAIPSNSLQQTLGISKGNTSDKQENPRAFSVISEELNSSSASTTCYDDISLAAYSLWLLYQRCTSSYIVNKIESDYTEIEIMSSEIKRLCERVTRLHKAKSNWQAWYESVTNLHKEYDLLTDLMKTLKIPVNDSEIYPADKSLDSHNGGLLPRVQQLTLEKFSPLVYRLPMKSIHLDDSYTHKNILCDLQQISNLSLKFSTINEDDISAFEKLADEIQSVAVHMEQMHPFNVAKYKQLTECLNTFLLKASLTCEKLERMWLAELK